MNGDYLVLQQYALCSIKQTNCNAIKTTAGYAFFLIWPLQRAFQSKANIIYFVYIQVM